MRHSLLILCATLLASGCASAPDAERLQTQLASVSRSAEDRARDPGRKPAEVLAFLGVRPGMTVLDVIAAGGWYSEVLAIAVGPEGRVYAQNPAVVLRMRDGANERALSARLAAGRLPNVQRLDREFADLGLPPESIDLAITALNFHDLYNRDPAIANAVLAAVHRVLAPGGVLGIIDHHGNPGADNVRLHRMREADAIAAAEAAGFQVTRSDLLANPADDRSRLVFAPGLRGNTDRFLLKLTKPQ